jgi:hypothetical protein
MTQNKHQNFEWAKLIN